MWHPGMNSDMNFPSLLAFPGLAAALVGSVVAVAAVVIFAAARQRRMARLTAVFTGAGATVYFLLLFGCSLISSQKVLARGQEKYFCEMDCHLAYSVVEVKQEPVASGNKYVVTLKTRFDEATISKHRPKDVPLTPALREVRLIDSAGRSYAPDSTSGVSLLQPLVPGESYTTELNFTVPAGVQGLKLLVHTAPSFLDSLLIGSENSLFHGKTYLGI